MASSIPAVSVAVYNGLRTLAAPNESLDGATVFYAVITGEDPGFDQIVVADERDIDRTSYLGGQQQRENYTLPIIVATEMASHDLAAAKARAMTLVAAVERWVRDNRAPADPAYSIDIDGHDDLTSEPTGEDSVRVSTAVNLTVAAVVTL
jgi:hypothetical protein